MREKRTSAVPILVAAVCLIVPLVAYVTGYFWLGDVAPHEGIARVWRDGQLLESRESKGMIRIYRTPLEAVLFQPAAWLESLARRTSVETRHH